MLKRIVAFLLVCVLCINLSGCSLQDFDLFSFFDKFKPTFTITFDLNYDGAGTPPAPQKIKMGETGVMEIPIRESHVFAGWYADKFFMQLFDLRTEKVYMSRTLYARWIDMSDQTDTDSDGLADAIEEVLKTSKSKKDTDGDGLSDYVEVMVIRTLPLKRDSDMNAVADGDEDADGDGIKNVAEVKLGTSPDLSDSDGDGLSDFDENNKHKTNALVADTDGDGAPDGKEIAYKQNPLEKDEKFIQIVTSDKISDANPVALKVTTELPGTSFGSVSIQPVTTADNAFVSSSIPGYLGMAYEITAEGDIDSAQLEFTYDTALGTVSSQFQPRIYLLNESTNRFEELPDQVITNGSVVAYTTHFSTYILLNKVQFEEVWDKEIKAPIIDNYGKPAHLDVAFAIDVSGSMQGERISTAKSALNAFIDALEEKDRAALIAFNSFASTLHNLGEDKSGIKQKVSQLEPGSQTAMYTGFRQALMQLTQRDKEYGYKMVVILSDGQDVPSVSFEEKYAGLLRTAVDNEIVVYTIGVGNNIDASVLERIAQSTGGAYYHATVNSQLTDVFAKLQEETINLKKDTNDDRIPDYFSNLLLTGKLVLSNGTCFAGYDFNSNADYDNDGRLNGEELVVTVGDDGQVYIDMVSHPLYADSDHDGFSDSFEIANGTNPLKISYLKHSTDALFDGDCYAGHLRAEKYYDDVFYRISVSIVNFLNLKWSPVEECQEVYMGYFNDCAVTGIDQETQRFCMYTLLDNANVLLEATDKYIAEAFETVKEVKDDVEYSKTIREALEKTKGYRATRDKLVEIISKIDLSCLKFTKAGYEKLADSLKSVWSQVKKNGVVNKFIVRLKTAKSNMAEPLFGKVSVGSVISLGVSTTFDMVTTVNTFAQLQANQAAYEQNIDVLKYVSQYGKTDVMKKAAQEILVTLEDEFAGFLNQQNEALLQDFASNAFGSGAGTAIGKLATKNPYVATVLVVYSVLDISLGLGKKAEYAKQLAYLDGLTDAFIALAKPTLIAKKDFYECKSDDPSLTNRYLTHIAQLRIVGERIFLDYGDAGLLAKSSEEARTLCNDNIKDVRLYAQNLRLTLAEEFAKD